MTTFECDEVTMEEHFNNVIKKNFSGKFADANYHIIRSDLPQEENIAAQQQINYKYGVGTSLVYCAESDWRWQWAAVGAATSKYLAGLSPKFDTYTEAQVWIQELMDMKSA